MVDHASRAAERDARDREANRRTLSMLRWLLYLVFVVIGWVILKRLAPILTPVVAAAAIAYLLDPLVEGLVARGVKRALAVSLLLVSFLVFVTATVLVLVPLLAGDAARFISDLPGWLDVVVVWGADALGYELSGNSWRDVLTEDELIGFLKSQAAPLFALAASVMGGAFSLLGAIAELLIIPVFAFYFLLDWQNLVTRVRRMIPQRHRAQTIDIVSEIDGVVAGWIRGQLTVTSILALLYAVAFKIIGLHLAVTMGLLVGLLTIIPFVGTIVGAGITVGLCLIDYDGPTQLIAVGGVFVFLHLLEAAVLTPKIVGHRVGLGEVGALFAVLAGGNLLGFTGVLLAVPIAASIAVLIRRLVRYYEGSEFFTNGAEEAWVDAATAAIPVDEDEAGGDEPAEEGDVAAGEDTGAADEEAAEAESEDSEQREP